MIKKLFKHYDYSLIISVLLLCGFGLVMVYSASMVWAVMRHETNSAFFFNRQIIWLIVSLVMFLTAMLFPYKAYRKFIVPILGVSIFLLILVRFVGSTTNNARSWIELGPFSFQPSEFVKLGLIIYLAAIYSKKQAYISNFVRGALPPLMVIGLIFALVASQPDLGTAMIIALTSGIVIICSGMKWKHIFGLVIIGAILFAGAWMSLSPEQASRFTGAYNPFSDPEDSGFHLINSYIAIASGGITGQGFGQSIQKYGFLPEPHTDFIMAIIAEELGLLGVVFVIGVLGYIVFKGFVIGIRCKDTFGSLLAIGISGMIGVQTVVNLGAITGWLPVTGVPLPFISYGGSSLILLMMSVGILINISAFVNIRKEQKTSYIKKDHAVQMEL
ncbi:putative lipid II flippase FtsW [Pseudalkalibacillus hwajinpoensis]|uniref:Probable peptidoglycan glycosyltransferase FtsW n=1 Tax=Guptibacillus hwajinpoensis TaxID=208199 RepID=A0A4U1MMI9_9BACL|nr:putative lipid II flippase FtsW [Pseudalkalibacillus hwajinpoensis]TKD71792.1 putative lipid II flippase FtsW [Pseudalkalibacillus hwajinpoensis]